LKPKPISSGEKNFCGSSDINWDEVPLFILFLRDA
jgi:hypothetical protein